MTAEHSTTPGNPKVTHPTKPQIPGSKATRNWAINFAAFLRSQLEEQNLRQADLAARADVDPARISNWVSEENPSRPKRRSCEALARALNLDETDVLRQAGYSITSIKTVPESQAWSSIFELHNIAAEDQQELQELLESAITTWKAVPHRKTPSHSTLTTSPPPLPPKLTIDYTRVSVPHMRHPDHRGVHLAAQRDSGIELDPADIAALFAWRQNLEDNDLMVCYNKESGYHRVPADDTNKWSQYPLARICAHERIR